MIFELHRIVLLSIELFLKLEIIGIIALCIIPILIVFNKPILKSIQCLKFFIVHSGKSEGIEFERMDQKHRKKNCPGSIGRAEGKCG